LSFPCSSVAHTFEDERVCQSFGADKAFSDEDRRDSFTHMSRYSSARAIEMESKVHRGLLKKTAGTWCFWSPEMCRAESEGFSGYASDLWAAGVCLYIFTTGLLPFFSLAPVDLFDLIEKANVQYEGLGLSKELVNLLSKMLSKDPLTRPGVRDCLKHDFCSNSRELRIQELSIESEDYSKHVILSQNDVDNALSVTVPENSEAIRQISERYSDSAASFTTSTSVTITKNDLSVHSKTSAKLKNKSKKIFSNLRQFRF